MIQRRRVDERHRLHHAWQASLMLEQRQEKADLDAIRMHREAVDAEVARVTRDINDSTFANIVHLMTVVLWWIDPKANPAVRPRGNKFVLVGNMSPWAQDWIAAACRQRVSLCRRRINKLRDEKDRYLCSGVPATPRLHCEYPAYRVRTSPNTDVQTFNTASKINSIKKPLI